MTDTIIKGSGNSRSIKSVPNLAALAPTWEKALELLTGEGLPIDLGPLNPAGLNVRGTDLNKAALLKDATAALYGLGADAVPDDVLKQRFGRIVYGTYTGTGSGGSDKNTPLVITFGFEPTLVLIFSCQSSSFNIGAYDASGYVQQSEDLQIFLKGKSGHNVRYNGSSTSVYARTTISYNFTKTGMTRYYGQILSSGSVGNRANALIMNTESSKYAWIAFC